MKEHKAATQEELLRWWPELAKLLEHANVIGIRIVCEGTKPFRARESGKERAAFQFGEV